MNPKNLFRLLRNVKIDSFQKGEIIIPKNSIVKNLFFIRKGLVRSYLNHEKGHEITFQFYAETQIFTNAHAILLNEPSRFDYQALEKTKLYSIEYEPLMQIASQNQDFLELNRTFLGKRIIKQAFQRIESFVFLSPEERYQAFLKEYPNIINRVPDMYIANVLGITPVSLSRIKGRIAFKKN